MTKTLHKCRVEPNAEALDVEKNKVAFPRYIATAQTVAPLTISDKQNEIL